MKVGTLVSEKKMHWKLHGVDDDPDQCSVEDFPEVYEPVRPRQLARPHTKLTEKEVKMLTECNIAR